MNLELRGFFRFIPLFALPIFLIVGLTGTIQAFRGDDQFGKVFMIIWMGVVVYQTIKFTKWSYILNLQRIVRLFLRQF